MLKLRFILILVVTCLLNSCFEIIEDVKINADGSGTFRYLINFSQSATKIKSIMLMDEIEGYAVPTQIKIQTNFDQMVDKSKSAAGISNVKSSADFDNFIFTYQCDFESIQKLNAVIDTLKANTTASQSNPTSYFYFSNKEKTFKRRGDNLLKNKYDKMTDAQKVIFANAAYTCLYRFENKIDTIIATNAKMSKSKMVSFQKFTMTSLAKNGMLINQEIKLK